MAHASGETLDGALAALEQDVKAVRKLAARLNKPPRPVSKHPKPDAFLECLYKAYQILNPPQKGDRTGKAIKLRDVHRLLTLRPGQPEEYGLTEFAKDIYLLDRSGQVRTRSGALATLHLDRSLTSASIPFLAETGEQKRYLGISFTGVE